MHKLFYLLFAVVAVILSVAVADYCPGHRIKCRKDQTCCSDNEGGYGCCPYQNASCCSDGLHCCPANTVCDIPHGRCNKKVQTTPLEKLAPSEDVAELPQNNNQLNAGLFLFQNGVKQTCPDGKRTCSDTYTCCPEKSGGYACCPFENGVCCSDNVHCCPQGHRCGVGSCDKI